MIPEAVMETIDGCFHIYLRSSLRSRFSLAHEIGHTEGRKPRSVS